MLITDIRTARIKGYKLWNWIRVDTDEGLSGYGEACPGAGVDALVKGVLRPLLLGQDPLQIEPLYSKMIGRTIGQSTGGILVGAISGVEAALWDLAGKALGVPIYQLLGGRYREKVRLYADAGHGHDNADSPEAWAQRAAEVAAEGFGAIKFDIDHSADELSLDLINRGLSLAELDKMEAMVAAVRKAVGKRVDICIDCHGLYGIRDALELAHRLEPTGLLFLEDPVPPENTEAMAKVTAGTRIPICTGEYLQRRDAFRPLVQTQGCDMLHIDAAATGGLLEAKKVADLADLYYMPFAAHNITSPLGLVASAHVCAAARNLHSMELPYHADQVPWRFQLLGQGDRLIQNGFLTVPDGPGLGVEIDEAVALEHLAEPGTELFVP